MFSKTLLLTLWLPLLVLAYPPGPRFTNLPVSAIARSTNASPPAIHAPTGDTLNRTACFCASRTWNLDQTFGFVYRISYYNAHLDRTYILEPACQSRDSVNVPQPDEHDGDGDGDKPVLQNECLRSRSRYPERHCTGQDTDENTFCYTFAGGPGFDTWAFGGQHRTGLPLEPVVNYTRAVVEEVCDGSCSDHVGGMEMLKGDAFDVLEGYYDLLGERLDSSVVFYPSIPDMCEGCK